MIKTYRSKDGLHYFTFRFKRTFGGVEVYCTRHPSLMGRDSDPHKTHLFRSGRICFTAGGRPRTQGRAEQLAGQWAEYYLEYRRSGRVQS
ncbi:MAG: hypothetical protein ACF8R7_12180 [Phycisphaerales bacterium JB039]